MAETRHPCSGLRAELSPGPLCGPTILHECTFRDGSTELVGLTACEVDRFEKKTEATCVPAAG